MRSPARVWPIPMTKRLRTRWPKRRTAGWARRRESRFELQILTASHRLTEWRGVGRWFRADCRQVGQNQLGRTVGSPRRPPELDGAGLRIQVGRSALTRPLPPKFRVARYLTTNAHRGQFDSFRPTTHETPRFGVQCPNRGNDVSTHQVRSRLNTWAILAEILCTGIAAR